MNILAVGVSYSSAPLALRERLSMTGVEVGAALARFGKLVREGFILSTCNRTELYAVAEEASQPAADAIMTFLAEWGGCSVELLRDAAFVYDGDRAVRHALRVASGLESMVLGEDQIQAQFKRAVELARHAESLGPHLDRLGTAALACGKRVRTFTGLGRHAVSLESLAVRAAVARCGSLDDRSIVVLGAGDSAELVLKHLSRIGARRLTIVSRSAERAARLAGVAGAEQRGLAELPEALATADVLFSCTSSPHPVVTPDFLAHRAALRRGHPLLAVDLGMPRDIDPAVGRLDGVTLVTLDELSGAAAAHREARAAHIPAAEAIVAAEVDRYMDWLRARGAAAAIAAVESRASAVAETELRRALNRLGAISPDQRQVVAELAHRIARKLSHGPKHALRQSEPEEKAALG